jgi:uncharacterized protein YjbI with pentapeptide repeats
MANAEQLDILNKGIEVWNQWRDENPDVEINLSVAIFSTTFLPGVNFSKANLSGTNFFGVNLSEANLTDIKLEGTLFFNVNLKKVKGLETCIHNASSYIDKSTILQSGKLPVKFLKGCGMTDSDIELSKLYDPALPASEIKMIFDTALELRLKESEKVRLGK